MKTEYSSHKFVSYALAFSRMLFYDRFADSKWDTRKLKCRVKNNRLVLRDEEWIPLNLRGNDDAESKISLEVLSIYARTVSLAARLAGFIYLMTMPMKNARHGTNWALGWLKFWMPPL